MAEPIEPDGVLLRGVTPSERGTSGKAAPKGLGARLGVPSGKLVLSAIELAMAAGSIFLCLRLFGVADAERQSFLSHNTATIPQRSRMLLELFATAFIPLFVSAIAYLRGGVAGLAWLPRAAELASPFILSAFLPSLLNYAEWYDKPLPYLMQLLAFVLILERLLVRAFGSSASPTAGYRPVTSGARTRLTHAAPLFIVVVFALGYGAYMSYYTILRHRLLGTAGFDLGIFDNLMFNALHGRPFRSTVAVPSGSYLSNHAEYGMFLFVPLYALRQGPETLLMLQSLFMGLAAVPLYLFASTQVSRAAAAAISIAYLFYAPLHGPNFYDFHWMPMAMFFFHWLFYAIARRKVLWIALLGAVCCSMREDAAFGLIAAGLFLIVTKYWVRMGAWMTVIAAIWFVIVKFIIMPWAGPWWFADIYKDLVASGERGYGSIVKTILINPNYFLKTLLTEPKLVYSLHLMAPLALIPLRNPALALLMLPGFAVTLMTTGYAPTVSITFQYTTTWIPFLFAAVALALRLRAHALGVRARRASVVALCVGVLCHSYVFGAILQHETFVGGFSRVYFTMSPGERQRYDDLRAVASRIPPSASVAATESEIPHVSTRLDAYTLKITSGEADYIFVNRHHMDAEAKNQVRSAMRVSPYGLVAKQGEFFLFAKHHESPETESTLKSLGLWTGKR